MVCGVWCMVGVLVRGFCSSRTAGRSDGWAGRSRCFSRSSRYGLGDEKWARVWRACTRPQLLHAQVGTGWRRDEARAGTQQIGGLGGRLDDNGACCLSLCVLQLLRATSGGRDREASASIVCTPPGTPLLKLWSAAVQFPLNPGPLRPKWPRSAAKRRLSFLASSTSEPPPKPSQARCRHTSTAAHHFDFRRQTVSCQGTSVAALPLSALPPPPGPAASPSHAPSCTAPGSCIYLRHCPTEKHAYPHAPCFGVLPTTMLRHHLWRWLRRAGWQSPTVVARAAAACVVQAHIAG
jgi:hypothetical protein